MAHNHHDGHSHVHNEHACCHKKGHAHKPQISIEGATVYTCPMHPEVRQAIPGICPLCGMALEPEAISIEEATNPEYLDMKHRFWLALILTLPVVVLEIDWTWIPAFYFDRYFKLDSVTLRNTRSAIGAVGLFSNVVGSRSKHAN